MNIKKINESIKSILEDNKVKAHVTNIEWDVDDEEDLKSLPTDFTIEVDKDDEDTVSDAISNEYGFCHKGFDYEIINESVEKRPIKESADDLLSWATGSELIHSNGEFEDYLVDITGDKFCVIGVTYETGDAKMDYQTSWYNTPEDAIKAYKAEFNSDYEV